MYTQHDDLSSGRNGITPVIIPDGDYIDTQMGEVMGFRSTGLPDDEPALPAIANALADVTDILLGEIEQRMSIVEAKQFLETNAPGIALRLDEDAFGYCNIAAKGFQGPPERKCRIRRVVNLREPAQRQEWVAENWRSAINACLQDLNPSQAA